MKCIGHHEDEIHIPESMDEYFTLTFEDNLLCGVDFNYDTLQLAMDGKGLCAIASNREHSAAELWSLYKLRDTVEKQFRIMKSELGNDTTRVHSDSSIESKLAACFIASVIRNEIMLASSKYYEDINEMLMHISIIHLTYMTDGKYHFCRSLSDRAKKLFGEFGLVQEHFVKFAEEINNLEHSLPPSQQRRFPNLEPAPKNKGGRPRTRPLPDPNQPKPKRGRPKGSLNKKTLERQALEQTCSSTSQTEETHTFSITHAPSSEPAEASPNRGSSESQTPSDKVEKEKYSSQPPPPPSPCCTILVEVSLERPLL